MHAALVSEGAEDYPGPNYEAVREHLRDMLESPFPRAAAGDGGMSVEEYETRKAVGLA